MTSPAAVTTQAIGRTLFCRTYPGYPSQVSQVRRDLGEIIRECALDDELILLASELSANAVVHSRSGQPGGRFTVYADLRSGQFAWLEVTDQGGGWDPGTHHDDRPHGLDIVTAIAGTGNWGVAGNGVAGRIVWVRLAWPDH